MHGRKEHEPVTSRILLIDDDSRLADMIGEYLRDFGYEVDN